MEMDGAHPFPQSNNLRSRKNYRSRKNLIPLYYLVVFRETRSGHPRWAPGPVPCPLDI